MPKKVAELTDDIVYQLRQLKKEGNNANLGINKFIEVVKTSFPALTNAQIKRFLAQEKLQKSSPSKMVLSRSMSMRKETVIQFLQVIDEDEQLLPKSKTHYKDLFARVYGDLGEDIFNAKRLEAYLDNKYTSKNTKISYSNVIKWVARNLKRTERSDLSELYDKYVKMRNDEKKEGVKTARENDNWIDFTDLVDLKNALKNVDSMYHFILSFFVDLPPMRSDICTVKCRNYNEATDNYYKEGYLYFNTRIKKNRDREDKFDLTFMERFIKDYMNSHDSDYLIGRKMSSAQFSSYLLERSEKHFQKRLGVQMLRKVWITNFFNEQFKNVNMELIQCMLRAVNHSLSTSMSYRRD